MPNGHWVKRHSALIAGLGGGILLLLFLIYSFVEQVGYNQHSQAQASNYARYAAEEQKNACIGIASPKLAECTAKAQAEYNLKTNAGDRDYSDLIAQRKSALWAMIMGIAALFGMILSFVGVILVKHTFDEAHRTNRLSMKEHARATLRAVAAADETAKAMAIAQRNADAAERTYQSNRAWITPDIISGEPFSNRIVNGVRINEGYEFTPIVKNTGLSPAIDVEIFREVAVVPSDHKLPIFGRTRQEGDAEQGASIIGPGNTARSTATMIGDADTISFRKGRVAVYIYCHASYHTIYSVGNAGQKHATEFTYRAYWWGEVTHPDGTVSEEIRFHAVGGQHTAT